MQIFNSYQNSLYQTQFSGRRTKAAERALKSLGPTAPTEAIAKRALAKNGIKLEPDFIRNLRRKPSISGSESGKVLRSGVENSSGTISPEPRSSSDGAVRPSDSELQNSSRSKARKPLNAGRAKSFRSSRRLGHPSKTARVRVPSPTAFKLNGLDMTLPRAHGDCKAPHVDLEGGRFVTAQSSSEESTLPPPPSSTTFVSQHLPPRPFHGPHGILPPPPSAVPYDLRPGAPSSGLSAPMLRRPMSSNMGVSPLLSAGPPLLRSQTQGAVNSPRMVSTNSRPGTFPMSATPPSFQQMNTISSGLRSQTPPTRKPKPKSASGSDSSSEPLALKIARTQRDLAKRQKGIEVHRSSIAESKRVQRGHEQDRTYLASMRGDAIEYNDTSVSTSDLNEPGYPPPKRGGHHGSISRRSVARDIEALTTRLESSEWSFQDLSLEEQLATLERREKAAGNREKLAAIKAETQVFHTEKSAFRTSADRHRTFGRIDAKGTFIPASSAARVFSRNKVKPRHPVDIRKIGRGGGNHSSSDGSGGIAEDIDFNNPSNGEEDRLRKAAEEEHNVLFVYKNAHEVGQERPDWVSGDSRIGSRVHDSDQERRKLRTMRLEEQANDFS